MLTQRGTATLGLGIAFCVGAWVLSLPELVAAGAALLALIAVALVWVWIPSRRPKLATSVQPSPALARSTVGVAVTLQLNGFRPAVVRAPISDGRRVRIWSRPGKAGTRSGSFPLAVGDRGELTVGPFSVHRYDPLALARRRLGNGARSRLIIWPEMHHSPPVTARVAAGEDRLPQVVAGQAATNAATDMEPAGLRSYVLGDELRLVHWTASARGRGMLIRTFDPAATVTPHVLFDDREISHTPESFELAVSVVASLIGASQPIGSGHTSARLTMWSHLDTTASNSSEVALWGSEAFDALSRAVPVVEAVATLPDHAVAVDLLITGPTKRTRTESQSLRRLVVDPAASNGRSITSLSQVDQWERFVQ